MRLSSLQKAFLFSILAHAILALSFLVAPLRPPALPPLSQSVSVEIISSKQRSPQQQKQIVELAASAATEPPDKADYLSSQNQKVKKQTVADQRGAFQNRQQKLAQQPAPAKTLNNPHKKSLQLFADKDPLAAAKQKILQQEMQSSNPIPSGAVNEVSQTQDYLKNVDKGLETLLNAREFKYYSYYNRIRRQLSEHWEPNVKSKVAKMLKEGRSPAAVQQDRITKLVVVLNQTGHLVKVQVLNQSGVQDLDDAAIEAFRAAAPFPNPPQGIIETDGTVKIRWDFILES